MDQFYQTSTVQYSTVNYSKWQLVRNIDSKTLRIVRESRDVPIFKILDF